MVCRVEVFTGVHEMATDVVVSVKLEVEVVVERRRSSSDEAAKQYTSRLAYH